MTTTNGTTNGTGQATRGNLPAWRVSWKAGRKSGVWVRFGATEGLVRNGTEEALREEFPGVEASRIRVLEITPATEADLVAHGKDSIDAPADNRAGTPAAKPALTLEIVANWRAAVVIHATVIERPASSKGKGVAMAELRFCGAIADACGPLLAILEKLQERAVLNPLTPEEIAVVADARKILEAENRIRARANEIISTARAHGL